MNIERIYISPAPGAPLVEQDRVTVVAGKGIVGDRNFDQHHDDGQNLTLVEAEEIEAFLREDARAHDLAITRRNLVTRGIRLNALVGVEFRVGEVRVRGRELCEPCMTLGTSLATAQVPAPEVIRRFLHRAGLRVDVLDDGEITRGAIIALPV